MLALEFSGLNSSFSSVKACVVVGYGPNEGDGEERDILRYVQDVRAVREMGRGLSDQNVVLCKVRLVGAWIKRK